MDNSLWRRLYCSVVVNTVIVVQIWTLRCLPQ